MIDGAKASPGRGELKPVGNRATWITWGLALQAIGVGIPVTVALRRANRDGALASITHYTVRLVWHEMLRSHADVALVVLGVLMFAAGAIVLARPFARRRVTLLVAVPLTAIAGLAVFGGCRPGVRSSDRAGRVFGRWGPTRPSRQPQCLVARRSTEASQVAPNPGYAVTFLPQNVTIRPLRYSPLHPALL